MNIIAAIVLAAAALSPADVIAQASSYDGKAVSVTGTVDHFQQRSTPMGNVSIYKLCGSSPDVCVTVVDMTGAPASGSATANGVFHTSLKTRQGTLANVVQIQH